VHEFRDARALLQKELDWSAAAGFVPPSDLKVGAMLETPAFAYALEDLGGEVDFISIGTNDLLQFFHAADRMTPVVADRYPFVSRPVMRFLKQVRQTCDRLGIPISVCGEGAGHPLQALCLIAVGYRSLSMPAGGIGPVKRMLRSLDLGAFQSDFEALLNQTSPRLGNGLLELVVTHGIKLADA
jgi:phosphotransferase system enzyme I (PtsP)